MSDIKIKTLGPGIQHTADESSKIGRLSPTAATSHTRVPFVKNGSRRYNRFLPAKKMIVPTLLQADRWEVTKVEKV